MPHPQTLFEKIWSRHVVTERPDGFTLLYIDRHLLHDGSMAAFSRLRSQGKTVRAPHRSFATPDHYVPTNSRDPSTITEPNWRKLVESIKTNTQSAGIQLFHIDDPRQGIVHVMGPEQGITQPGITLVCGDSHTATHGALGAIAFGIGSSEVTHVLATQTVWQKKPKTMRISVDGTLGTGVTGKDVIIAIIAKMGAAGATGHAVEFAGSAIRSLSMEGRLTLCNMTIEGGGRSGTIAPDDTTYQYLHGRPYAPKGAMWDKALAYWRTLPSDAGAKFDTEISLDGASIAPMVTWGNSPEDAAPVTGRVPDPASASDPTTKANMERALAYMDLKPGTAITDITVDRVFIGSCTNSRIEDLREAAKVAKGRKAVISAWVVPGSGLVKRQAEAEGLDKIFKAAGFEWREAGCSMCIGTNGDTAMPGQRVASTSNRNFQGRQGPGARTHLVSPGMAAAAAVTGRFADVRQMGV